MLTAIVSVDQNWGIGRNGDQLVYIPEDLKHFKDLTKGKAVIYGRKTLNTFPNKKPLSDRQNYMLSKTIKKLDNVRIFSNILELFLYLPEDAFVIGGESVYKKLFPFIQSAIVTKIEYEFSSVDSYFPNLDNDPNWILLSQSEPHFYNGINYKYAHYERRDKNGS